MAKYEKTQRARQYMPGAAKKGAVAQAPASQATGKPNTAQTAQTNARQSNKKGRKR